MKVLFRTDASVKIGVGHVMRCLTLAEALREAGAECRFICREYPGHLLDLIRRKGFVAHGLPFECDASVAGDWSDSLEGEPATSSDLNWTCDAAQTKVVAEGYSADWLVVDHYGVDARWERTLRSMCRRLMVIDDLADRSHECDLLLDQNYYHDSGERYSGLVPRQCVALLGPAYVLLRPEFITARQRLRKRDGHVRRILVCFGGTDPSDQTTKVLSALRELNRPEIAVDVVVGQTNVNRTSIQSICEELPNVKYHCQVSNMAELVLNADLGIGAGGSAMWERCYLGLPTITVALASNQVETTEAVSARRGIEYLGRSTDLKPIDYRRAVSEALNDRLRIKQIGDAAICLAQAGNAVILRAMHSMLQRAPEAALKD